MLAKRIIPCLDVRDGRVVKGVNFVNIRDAGDPVELARYYSDQGADEIVFLDITATHEARKTVAHVVEKTAEQVFVPLTVGGGIRTLEDFRELLRAGADKISVNSAAVARPELITQAAERFGSQCVVLAVDARSRGDGTWEVVVAGGRKPTGLDLLDWVKRGEALGAGEILLTSMDADGTKAGFDLGMTRAVTEAVSILEKDGSSSNSDLLYLNETSFSTAMENRLAMGSAIGGGGLYGSTSFLQEHVDMVQEGQITLEGLGVTEQEIERIELTSSNAPSFFGTVGGIVLAFVLLVYSAYGMLSARKTDAADKRLSLIGSTRKERLVFSVGEVGVSVLPPYLLGTILSLILFPYWNGAMFSHQLLPHGYLHSFSWGYPVSLLAAIVMIGLLALPPCLRIYRKKKC